MKCKKLVCGCMVFMLIFGMCACGKKEKAKEAAPDLVLELPKEKENSASDSEETVSGMDEATQNEDIPEKKGILIAIDPGHQAPDVDMSAKEPNAPGSNVMRAKATGGTSGRYSGIAEYELNLAISLMLREALQNEGYDVIMTREDNETAISNAERATMANDAGADIAIRIHANGSENSSANGALVLIGSAGNPYVGNLYDESNRLAQDVLDNYCAATGMANQGIQVNDTMTGINWSKIPVIILEMGFMTNQQDDLNMADSAYRQKMVEGIVSGVNEYYQQ